MTIPRDGRTEVQLISLLHLDNHSGLQCLMKNQLLDYNTLERYLYCDIIPVKSVSINYSTQSETEEEDDATC